MQSCVINDPFWIVMKKIEIPYTQAFYQFLATDIALRVDNEYFGWWWLGYDKTMISGYLGIEAQGTG